MVLNRELNFEAVCRICLECFRLWGLFSFCSTRISLPRWY